MKDVGIILVKKCSIKKFALEEPIFYYLKLYENIQNKESFASNNNESSNTARYSENPYQKNYHI